MPPDRPQLFSSDRVVAFVLKLGWFALVAGVPILLIVLVILYSAFTGNNG
jgi:hypothetical protein